MEAEREEIACPGSEPVRLGAGENDLSLPVECLAQDIKIFHQE